MGKSILLIDTPRDCFGCPCYSSIENKIYFCNKENRVISKQDIEKSKPDWCPIRDLPDKMKYCDRVSISRQHSGDYMDGFNACIDEVLKGGEVE